MKFESKFGIGEIVLRTIRKGGDLISDDMFEVLTVAFGKEGTTYACRAPGGQIFPMMEYELEGDPDFNQEQGVHPVEDDVGRGNGAALECEDVAYADPDAFSVVPRSAAVIDIAVAEAIYSIQPGDYHWVEGDNITVSIRSLSDKIPKAMHGVVLGLRPEGVTMNQYVEDCIREHFTKLIVG